MDTGINPPEAYNGIYGTKRVHHMHLLAKILNTAATNQDETIAWIVLKKDDIDCFASDVEDTHGFINNLLVLNNIKVACMFRDDGNLIKMSLRSSGEYDVGRSPLIWAVEDTLTRRLPYFSKTARRLKRSC